MPHPVEIDIAVGIGGDRCAFHLEIMAHVNPLAFVNGAQMALLELIAAGGGDAALTVVTPEPLAEDKAKANGKEQRAIQQAAARERAAAST